MPVCHGNPATPPRRPIATTVAMAPATAKLAPKSSQVSSHGFFFLYTLPAITMTAITAATPSTATAASRRLCGGTPLANAE